MRSFSHPDTFITLGELAGVLRDQDKLEEAQNTYEMLLENRIVCTFRSLCFPLCAIYWALDHVLQATRGFALPRHVVAQ